MDRYKIISCLSYDDDDDDDENAVVVENFISNRQYRNKHTKCEKLVLIQGVHKVHTIQ